MLKSAKNVFFRYIRANRDQIRKQRQKVIEELEYLGIEPQKDPDPRFFFHTTYYRALERILSSGELRSNHYVSVAERPLIRGPVDFGNIALKFSSSISDQLVKVKYNLKWLYKNSDVAAYIIGPGNLPPEDLSKDQRLELAQEALDSQYSYQKEWVSWRKNNVKFRPKELEAILVEDPSLSEKIEFYTKDLYPEYRHVKIQTLR